MRPLSSSSSATLLLFLVAALASSPSESTPLWPSVWFWSNLNDAIDRGGGAATGPADAANASDEEEGGPRALGLRAAAPRGYYSSHYPQSSPVPAATQTNYVAESVGEGDPLLDKHLHLLGRLIGGRRRAKERLRLRTRAAKGAADWMTFYTPI